MAQAQGESTSTVAAQNVQRSLLKALAILALSGGALLGGTFAVLAVLSLFLGRVL